MQSCERALEREREERKIQFGGKRARLKLISIILSYLIPESVSCGMKRSMFRNVYTHVYIGREKEMELAESENKSNGRIGIQ
jgi:hypothetical protein